MTSRIFEFMNGAAPDPGSDKIPEYIKTLKKEVEELEKKLEQSGVFKTLLFRSPKPGSGYHQEDYAVVIEKSTFYIAPEIHDGGKLKIWTSNIPDARDMHATLITKDDLFALMSKTLVAQLTNEDKAKLFGPHNGPDRPNFEISLN